MADLLLRIAGDYAAGDAMEAARNAVEGMGEKLIDFAKESLKAFGEQEVQDKRLAAAAGELADVFDRQANAMKDTLGVSDDMVKQMQTMLLQFGEAPKDINATVQALLDYSARTGTDAVGATQALLSSAKSGRIAFKDLNLEYEKTTSATQNVVNITQALSGVVGGAAAAESDTLVGRTRKLNEAWDDVKKGFGGFLAQIESSFGVLEKLKGLLKDLQAGFKFIGKIGINSSWSQISDAWETSTDEVLSGGGTAGANDQARLNAGGPGRPGGTVGRGGAGAGGAGGSGNKRFDGGKLTDENSLSAWDRGLEEDQAAVIKRIESSSEQLNKILDEQTAESEKKLSDGFVKAMEGVDKDNADLTKKLEDSSFKTWDIIESAEEKSLARQQKMLEESHKKMLADLKEQEGKWEAAGKAIGNALANALAGAITELMGGGEIDVNQMVGDILSSVWAAAAPAIGSAFGPIGAIIGGFAGPIGGALIKGATRTPKKPPTRHEGGWEGVPRYHSGGWPGLEDDEHLTITQEGERTLSKREVSQMGGPGAVDAAARGKGGRGFSVHVSAMDAKSMRDFISDEGGQGFARAIRTGRGDAARLFGAGRVT